MDIPSTITIRAAAERYNDINETRRLIKSTAGRAKQLATDAKNKNALNVGEDGGETIANLMLAYRHLEDASMRLGKALQSIDGGVSVYDRATTVGA